MENRNLYILEKFQSLPQNVQTELVSAIGIDNAVLLLNKSFDELSIVKKAEIISKISPELMSAISNVFSNLK